MGSRRSLFKKRVKINVSIATQSDKLFCLMISFLLHATLFLAGNFVFSKPIEYAVQEGMGGIEISLIAAPADELDVDQNAQELSHGIEQEPVSEDPDDALTLDTPVKENSKKVENKKQLQTAANSPYKGDGSSSAVGKDNTTFYSSGGAMTEAKPNYLRNPAPAYPREARQQGWEGVIVIKVVVNQSGYPTQIDKEETSGFDVLDESALNAVRKWKFMPAKIGSIPIQSIVRIPIKFKLEE